MSSQPCENTRRKSKKKCIKQCTKADFDQAVKVSDTVDRAINRTTLDPVGSTRLFADQFALGGLFSISFNPATGPFLVPSNTYGRENIYNFFLGYAQNPGEINMSVKPELFVWDCLKRTLVVEREWNATLTQPRVFLYGPTGPQITLPAGVGYSQDDAIVYQFDCDYKLVYNREYFDTTQFVSTYPQAYAPVCKIKCCQEKKEAESSEAAVSEIPPCTDCDRDRATQVFDQISFALNLLSYDANLSANLFTGLFAPCGVWSTPINPSTYPYVTAPQANFVGLSQILNFYLSYALNPGETDQTVTTREVYWDCNTRTLAVERLWEATLTAPRTFNYGTGGGPGPTTFPAGYRYQQDDLVLVRFDCDFKIVFYREYFDFAQYQSTYRNFVAPVCSKSCDCSSCEKCFKQTHKKCNSCGPCARPCILDACALKHKPRSVKCHKCDRGKSGCDCRK